MEPPRGSKSHKKTSESSFAIKELSEHSDREDPTSKMPALPTPLLTGQAGYRPPSVGGSSVVKGADGQVGKPTYNEERYPKMTGEWALDCGMSH